MKKFTVFKNPDTGEITGAVLEYNNKFLSFDEAEVNELMLEKNIDVSGLTIPLNWYQIIEEIDE